ncbi:MAG TPA: hypothetical protein VGF56_00635 [Rhizomicrobium sp.]
MAGATVALGVLAAITAADARGGSKLAKCASPDEVSAIQTAAIQQQLMVAALTCNEIEHFNAFQTGYGPELRTSDSRLEHMFKRIFGAGAGEAQYHAFKTRLANNSSMNSIHDNTTYCHTAQTVFAAALAPASRQSLADFVKGVPVSETSPVNSCEIRVAGGLQGLPASVIVPKPNPLRLAMEPTLFPQPAPAAQAVAQPAAPATDATVNQAAQQPKPEEEKKSGWLSGIFN